MTFTIELTAEEYTLIMTALSGDDERDPATTDLIDKLFLAYHNAVDQT